MRAPSRRRVASPYLGIAAVVVGATAFGYVHLLDQQGEWPGIEARSALILGLLGSSTTLAGIGALTGSRALRACIAAACAGVLLPLGFLALFSIGLPLMAAGTLALTTWVNTLREAPSQRASVLSGSVAIGALVILAVGLVGTASAS